MYKLDKIDFIKVLQVDKPKVIEFHKYIPFFDKYHFRFIHKEYYYETICYECRVIMEKTVDDLKINIVEIN